MALARAQMILTPSCRVRHPATTAATTSPAEWPMSTVGSTPMSAHTRLSAYCSAKSDGCASRVRDRGAPCWSNGARITSCEAKRRGNGMAVK
jgi:hypothetical protein